MCGGPSADEDEGDSASTGSSSSPGSDGSSDGSGIVSDSDVEEEADDFSHFGLTMKLEREREHVSVFDRESVPVCESVSASDLLICFNSCEKRF